jgi:hypothetical protein
MRRLASHALCSSAEFRAYLRIMSSGFRAHELKPSSVACRAHAHHPNQSKRMQKHATLVSVWTQPSNQLVTSLINRIFLPVARFSSFLYVRAVRCNLT